MVNADQRIWEICRFDPRYPVEAYQFVLEALNFTQGKLGRRVRSEPDVEPAVESHVSGGELVTGACDFAKREFGFMARIVFRQWGIRLTDDIGNLVFNMIESGLLSKTERDTRADFHNLFDVDRALADGLTIDLDLAVLGERGSR